MGWKLRGDLVRVAVPPRRSRLTEAGLIVLPGEEMHPGPFLGVVTQVGHRVQTLRPGMGVLFGSLVGEWWNGDLLMAETDIEAIVE
jgi:hypothetical protein